jgi:alkylated DNA nucleotide flippase Atl1
VVDTIPAGRVMSYGDISEWIEEGSPRLVARVMATYGSEVPWWRVLRNDGTCASEVIARQAPLLTKEGVAWKVPNHRVAMSTARWNPASERLNY